MRTTLSIDDDAMKEIQVYAENSGISLGKAASDLIRRGAQFRLGVRTVNGLPVFDVPQSFPSVSTEMVRDFLNSDE